MPVRDLRVRYRQTSGQPVLVRENRFLFLDATGASIWRAIDGKATVADIAVVLADNSRMRPGEALVAVVSLVFELEKVGYCRRQR
ncbi:PqqD family protein [Arthrobacter zhaoguopingii]|uniref:PqqD family protein n=1 Tax=Arthrobacter zhaoguopingii TaxID=2681491 RepID=UPI0019166C09